MHIIMRFGVLSCAVLCKNSHQNVTEHLASGEYLLQLIKVVKQGGYIQSPYLVLSIQTFIN